MAMWGIYLLWQATASIHITLCLGARHNPQLDSGYLKGTSRLLEYQVVFWPTPTSSAIHLYQTTPYLCPELVEVWLCFAGLMRGREARGAWALVAIRFQLGKLATPAALRYEPPPASRSTSQPSALAPASAVSPASITPYETSKARQ